MKETVKLLPLLLFFLAAPLYAQMQIGYDQTGGVHLTGPGGIDVHGAYRFRDFCTPLPQAGMRACYQIAIVLEAPLSGLPPDLVLTDEVFVWGTEAGHYCWRIGEWTIEMVAIDETIRQQVSWEAAGRGVVGSGVQTVNITVGKDTITFAGRKY